MQRVTHQSGFSVIELIVTIVIIGLLSVLVVVTPKSFLVDARDRERQDDIASIARRLEQAYQSQDIGSPAYPSTTELAADISGDTRTMTRLQPEALRAPGSSTSSIIPATSTSTTAPAGVNSPTLGQYVYQPLRANGALCTTNPSTAAPCVRFYLYYRIEKTNTIKFIKSLHQQ